MAKNGSLKERRSHERYQAHERALVKIPHSTLPYHIIDISLTGLAIRYIGRKKWPDEIAELDIVFTEKIIMQKAPITTISDVPLADGYIPMRRLGMKFGDLTPQQKSQLESFISNHTICKC